VGTELLKQSPLLSSSHIGPIYATVEDYSLPI